MFRISVNGAVRSVQSDPSARLVDVLRDRLGLVGTRLGFAECVRTRDLPLMPERVVAMDA